MQRKFKVKNYSNERLVKELQEAKMRLSGYLQARKFIPASSILGSLSVSYGIKYESSLIAALEEEIQSRGL